MTTVNFPCADSGIVIWSGAFYGCDSLKSLSFSGKPTRIELQRASLAKCPSIERFIVPSKLTSLICFNECENLKEITIPETVDKSFGIEYLTNCPNLTKINIPKQIQTIKDGTFANCPKLVVDVYGPSAGYRYVKKNGIRYNVVNATNCGENVKWFYDDDEKTVIVYGSGKMDDYPNNNAPWLLDENARYAEKIVVESGVTNISENAFFNMSSVKEVSIADTVKTIGNGAFEGNTALETVNFSKNIESIGKEAFSGCTSLKRAEIPNSVESIGDKAFNNCESLKELTIPDSVKTIGTDIVKNTSKDLEIKTTDGSAAADYAEKIGAKTSAKSTATLKAEAEAKRKAEEAKKKAPGKGAVLTYKNLKYKVTKAGSDKTVGTVTLTGATKKNLKSVTVADKVNINGITYKVTAIGANAFKGQSKMTKAVIGVNIANIGKNAFNGAKNLKSVTIKTTKLTKKNVGAGAFKGINAKATIKVPAKKLKAYTTILRSKGASGKKQKITK